MTSVLKVSHEGQQTGGGSVGPASDDSGGGDSSSGSIRLQTPTMITAAEAEESAGIPSHVPPSKCIVELVESPTEGRYAVAGRDIPAGTLVHMSLPYATVMYANHAATRCRCCFALLEGKQHKKEESETEERETSVSLGCDVCFSVFYCSEECRNTYHAYYHSGVVSVAGVEGGEVSETKKDSLPHRFYFGEDCDVRRMIGLIPQRIKQSIRENDVISLQTMMTVLRKVELETRYDADAHKRQTVAPPDASCMLLSASVVALSKEYSDDVSANGTEVASTTASAANSCCTTPSLRPDDGWCAEVKGPRHSKSSYSTKQYAAWLKKDHPRLADGGDENSARKAEALALCTPIDAPMPASEDEKAKQKLRDEALCAAALENGGLDFDAVFFPSGSGDQQKGGSEDTLDVDATESKEEVHRIRAIQEALIHAEVADPNYCRANAGDLGPARLRRALEASTRFADCALLKGCARDGSVMKGGLCPHRPCTFGMRSDGESEGKDMDSYNLRLAVTPRWGDVAHLVSNYSVMPKNIHADAARIHASYVKVRRFLITLPVPKKEKNVIKTDSSCGLAVHPSSTLVDELHPYFLPEVSLQTFSSILFAFQCNTFGVYGKTDVAVAHLVLPFASYFNHSCNPNLVRVMTGGIEARFYALRDIKKGEWLCISYTDAHHKKARRRRHLLRNYRFLCLCSRCCDNEDNGGVHVEEVESNQMDCESCECEDRGFMRPLLGSSTDGRVMGECNICRGVRALKAKPW